jgi:hypothetical protein
MRSLIRTKKSRLGKDTYKKEQNRTKKGLKRDKKVVKESIT